MKLDRTDAKILDKLQRDGRTSVVDIAAAVGLSPTPCNRRIVALEKEGVIEGYAASLNPNKIGLQISAFIQVRLERHTDQNVERFAAAIESFDEVLSCHAVTGEHDFVLHIVAPDLETLRNVVLSRLLKIPSVRDVQSSIVLDSLKRTNRLPLHHLQRS
jgi:Lrp/AsnC family transcriptional regulator, leucine-responsive regulatory protein